MTNPSTPDPPQKDANRYANNTTKYNALNAMMYPQLYGVQQTTIPKTSEFIKRELNNVDRYMLGYALGGRTLQAMDNGTQVKTEKGMYYNGADMALGSNYFIPLGTCGKNSDKECIGKPKMVYLRNIPTGYIPLLGNVSVYSITGCNINGFTNGLGTIPGMLEDLSEFGDAGNDNVVGDTCERIRLPVGSRIYDPMMQCNLDYSTINKKPTIEGRYQETQKQVLNNCNNKGVDNKTWWYEERCTPSYNYAVHPSLLNPAGANTNHESIYIPMPKPIANAKDTLRKIPPLPEQFQNSTNKTLWHGGCWWIVWIAVVVILFGIYVGYNQ